MSDTSTLGSFDTLCCSGVFPSVEFFDEVLIGQFRVDTSSPEFEQAERTYRFSNCSRVIQLKSHSSDSSSSERIIGVGSDRFPGGCPVLVYDVNLEPSRQLICQCVGHSAAVWGIASVWRSLFANAVIVSGSTGLDEALVFDASTGDLLQKLDGSTNSTCQMMHIPQWDTLYVCGGAPQLVQYDSAASTGFRRVQDVPMNSAVWAIAASLEYSIVFAAPYTGRIRFLDGKERSAFGLGEIRLTTYARSCVYAEDMNGLIVGLESGQVEHWDIRQTSKRLRLMKVAEDTIWDLARIGDDTFACGSSDGSLCVCDVQTGKVPHKAEMGGCVYGVCALRCDADVFEGRLGSEVIQLILLEASATNPALMTLVQIDGFEVLAPKSFLQSSWWMSLLNVKQDHFRRLGIVLPGVQ